MVLGGETDDAEVTDGDNPKEKNETLGFWKNQIDGAIKAAKRTNDATRDAIEEYIGTFSTEPTLKRSPHKPEERYPLLWASIKTIQPALYSRTPVAVIEQISDDLDDNLARLTALGMEKVAKHCQRSCPFDRVMYSTRDTFILSGKTTARVTFESEISSTPIKKYYTQTQGQQVDPQTGQPLPEWIDDEGDILPMGAHLLQDENGFYVDSNEESLDAERVPLTPIAYDDILHTPNARHWEEIDWIAFKTLVTKDDVTDRWDEQVAKDMNYSDVEVRSDKGESLCLPTKYATIYEIWDKRKKKVRWMSDGYKPDTFIEEIDDPWELSGFFPCPPFMLGTTSGADLYPTPDYIQLKPIIMQLHALFKRFKTLVRAVRRRGLVDGSIPELIEMANEADEAEWITVMNFAQQISQKGGLENIIQWFPVDTLVSAIQQLSQVFQDYEAKFNEIYGIPDILRGVSDPSETAAAQQMKGHYTSLRFSAIQRDFQRLVRDCMELQIDLALKKFSENKLAEIMNVKHWDVQDQALFPQVLLLLRDDNERKLRIDIETDSTITQDQDQEVQNRTNLMTQVFQGIQSLAQVQQTTPQMLPVVVELLMYTVRGMRDGKHIEEKLRQAADQILNPPPPQPPQPDPMVMIKQQEVQIKGQQVAIQGQKAQSDFQIEQAKLGQKDRELQVHAGVESSKVQASTGLKGAEIQTKAGIEQAKLEEQYHYDDLEHSRGQDETAIKVAGIHADIAKAGADNQLKALELKIETQLAQMQLRMEALHASIQAKHNDNLAALQNKSIDASLAKPLAEQPKGEGIV